MAYNINYTDPEKGSISIEDGTIDETTTLPIPGRNTTSYGSIIGQNFLQLLENFAAATEPTNPVEGQLWYDNGEGVNTLKIYDGTSWVSAGGIKKGTIAPDVATSLPGDIWSDIDNNQLYLFTGSGWILVGPEFSDGLLTGTKPTIIVGQDDIEYTVLQVEVQGNIIAIYSTKQFNPKSKIQGLDTIYPGLNLTSRDITGDGAAKYYGTSEKAESLIVNGEAVAGSNFLRTDTASLTTSPVTIRSNLGLTVGQDGLMKMTIEGATGVITNLTSGSSIDMRVNNLGTVRTVVTVDSAERVGINNTSPIEALDVTGNIQSSGSIIVNDTTQSSSIGTGSLTTKGGAGIAKNLYVGSALDVTGSISSNDIIPKTNNTADLGSATNNFRGVYATKFYGNLEGNITGTVTGRSGSTNKLAQATTFQLAGDVSSNAIVFDGQQGGTNKVFTTEIANDFIANKDEVSTSNIDDEFVINRTSGNDLGVKKISQRNLLAAVTGTTPVGTVVPYAGDVAPAGWLMCDGTEVAIGDYLDLFQTISYKFKDQSITTSGKFGLPDLRGRFALGADNMGGSSANRVTNVNADVLGNSGGFEKYQIEVENLPEHEHDMRGPSGAQYYAVRDIQGQPADAEAIQYDAPQGSQAGQAYPTSGGVLKRKFNEDGSFETITTLGEPFDVMSPFTTMNYIIYSGVGG
jgi:microcystin-dependent protein